jgi:hypothetical protein
MSPVEIRLRKWLRRDSTTQRGVGRLPASQGRYAATPPRRGGVGIMNCGGGTKRRVRARGLQDGDLGELVRALRPGLQSPFVTPVRRPVLPSCPP